MDERVAEPGVVHHAVVLVALQLRGGVEEVFAHVVGVGVGLFDGFADGGGDFGADLGFALATEHVGDIDAPAIGRKWRLQPFAHDGIFVFVHAAAQRFALVVELGQRPHAQPCRVLIGVLVKVK